MTNVYCYKNDLYDVIVFNDVLFVIERTRCIVNLSSLYKMNDNSCDKIYFIVLVILNDRIWRFT